MGEIENREETQIKDTKNISNKFIEENIPNLKVEVPIMVQKHAEHQIEREREEIFSSHNNQTIKLKNKKEY